MSTHHYHYIQQFRCLGGECEDTCCKGWGMQLDEEHRALYAEKAPELLDAVVSAGDTPGGWIMRRDPATDYCVKFDNGLCGIQNAHGDSFLGDACHFYPRITRRFGGEETMMSATLSCPEITRLALYGETPFQLHSLPSNDRLPNSLKNYTVEGLTGAQMQDIIARFLAAADEPELTAPRLVARILSVAKSLENLPVSSWQEAIPFYLKTADSRLLPPEKDPFDPYLLLQVLLALLQSAPKSNRPRLDGVIKTIKQKLDIKIESTTLAMELGAAGTAAYHTLEARWQAQAATHLNPQLKLWVQSQLAMASFPFAGLGQTPFERAVLMAIRFATVRLALMCHMAEDGTPPPPETVVYVIQSLSRFLDHLADPTLSLAVYREAGWLREARLLGIIL